MHKKSIEAASKMKEEEIGSTDTAIQSDSIKTESIATLRAKAQQHSSKMMEVLHRNNKGEITSRTTANSSFNSSFLSDTDVTICQELSRQ